MIKSLVLTGLILASGDAKNKETEYSKILTTACIIDDVDVYLTIDSRLWRFEYTDLDEETDEDFDGWYYSDYMIGLVKSDMRLLVKTVNDSIIVVKNVKPCL